MINTHPPFLENTQLTRDSSANLATRYSLQDTPAGWLARLHSDLETKLLDDLYGHLWLVARKDGSHIDALHEHLLKGRSIVVAETPRLHLVWHYGTVYIKPLPEYLLNHNIWNDHLSTTVPASNADQANFDPYRSALGFLRSYSLLTRHESDYVIAQRACLIPKYVSFQRWQIFMQLFRQIEDDEVSRRYRYGQFRLSRLNLMTHIVRVANLLSITRTNGPVPWEYQNQVWQTGQYLSVYVAPLIFVFAMLSLILSSMQVVLAARGEDTWEAFVRVSWGFSVATIIFSTVPITGAFVIVTVVLLNQGQFALHMRLRDRTLKQKKTVANSGVGAGA